MSTRRLSLSFSSGELCFDHGDHDWCDVVLIADDCEIPLGAETLSYVTTRLSAFLERPPLTQKWILSLSERHCSAYGRADVEGGATLLVQDRDTRPLAQVNLTLAERRAWLVSLVAFSKRL